MRVSAYVWKMRGWKQIQERRLVGAAHKHLDGGKRRLNEMQSFFRGPPKTREKNKRWLLQPMQTHVCHSIKVFV